MDFGLSFLSNDQHGHICPDEKFAKAASCFLINVTPSLLYPHLLPSWVSLCCLHSPWCLENNTYALCPSSQCSGQGVWSWVFLKASLSLPSLFLVCTRFHAFPWHLHCVDGERVHICYGKLLPQMCPENPRSRSSCSLRKPSQMPGRRCEVFVIASQALPVQLRNSCMYNTLHLLGCHKSWRTEGKLWNHIFPWLIRWEGKHFRKKTTALRVSHTPLCRLISWISGFSGCRFGSR